MEFRVHRAFKDSKACKVLPGPTALRDFKVSKDSKAYRELKAGKAFKEPMVLDYKAIRASKDCKV